MSIKKYSSVSNSNNNSSSLGKSKSSLLQSNSLSCVGCKLFALFKPYHLIAQQRAKDDPEHFEFTLNLSKGDPIDLSEHLSKYKLYSKSDIQSDSDKWQFAPFLVATNQERIQISYHQAKQFAIANNTYIYKWPVNLHKWQNRPKIRSHQQRAQKEPIFWQ